MSEAARFITGQIIYVDGEWLATFVTLHVENNTVMQRLTL